MRVTGAPMCIFGDMPDTRDAWCCTAAVVAPLTLREGFLPPSDLQTAAQRQKQTLICSPSIFSHETSPLVKRFFRRMRPRNIPRGPQVLGPRSIQTTVELLRKAW